jgi:MFS family permease
MCSPPKVPAAGNSGLLAKLRGWPNASAVVSVFADYLGLAMLTPSLPFYLSEKGLTDSEIPFWNGAITTAQFAAIVIGNVFWGRFCDRTSSWRALQVAMLGDTVFFALSAGAPFGLRGAPSAGIMLAVVRFFAGLFTPLVSAVLYIFDRERPLERL